MNLFGIIMELHNQHTEKRTGTTLIYTVLPGSSPWVVGIALFFVSGGCELW